MADAVIVVYRDGREYEVESAAVARKAHPDARIARFARTQEPYSEGAHPSPPAHPPVAVPAPVADLTEHTPDEPAPARTSTSTSTKGRS